MSRLAARTNVDDLLEPLRYNNLSNFLLSDVRSIGGGVFVEEGSLDHLRILDLVVKGYQSVHIPTFGHPIPGTSQQHNASISSATDTKVITPAIGEVLKLSALSLLSAQSGTTVSLYIYDNDTNSQVMYWAGTELPANQTITPFLSAEGGAPLGLHLEIPYGQQLLIKTASSGTVDLTVRALTIKTQQ